MPMPGVYQKIAEGQQVQRRIGTVENPKKFKGQDFDSIRETCYSRRQLFEDETFPAHVNSIGQKVLPKDQLLSVQWERPKEIQRDARLLVDGASIFDIVQGQIGDCWVLSAVGALTLHQKFLDNVIPKDQEFNYKYAGVFHFRFWQFGEWVDVVIDDRLPMLNGKYLSVQPRSGNEFWPGLLEKAYAKLHGSYQNLHWGYISEALVDFSGGVQVEFDLMRPPQDLRDIVIAAAKTGSLLGCITPGNKRSGNPELKNGLVQGHAYTVTDATKVEYKNGTEDLIRIWNPWGKGEWNGRWSDNSPQWDQVRADIRHKLNVQKNDGEFWISCQDFLQNFSFVSICNHTPAYFDFENPKRAWQELTYFDRWVKGSTAAGCSTSEDLWRNPQFVISVSDSEGMNRGYNVTVALMQSLENQNKYNQEWMGIGFAFCKVASKGVKSLSQQNYSPNQAVDVINTEIQISREITRSFRAPPGTYVVIPFTQSKGLESEFLLRIFLKTKEIDKFQDTTLVPREGNQTYPSDSRLRYQDTKPKPRDEKQIFNPNEIRARNQSNSSLPREENQYQYASDAGLSEFSSSLSMNSQIPKAVLKKYQNDGYEKVFIRYCNKSSELYAEQLQKLLNEVLIKDQTFNASRGDFTLDACRGILMLMDLNANGRLNLQEFERLWKRLSMCKDIFRSIDLNQTGFVDASGLRKAAQLTGLPISNAVINVMVLRYANSLEKLNFADFVCCIIRLETVTKVFKNLSKDGRGVYLSGEEWMQIIMSS
ncbi:calpain 13 L homeolog [Xenopus laevis]|uniref:Calpain 13 L homeolog n=1 Tax=Xenopus laevis TaxID=8355 RepID=Q7ZYF3_XENLA|nr:calpain 13 L homeolog [Xenopus laevis]AAH43810.1 MGC53127 protein [Xenopus laevis]